MAFTSHFRLGVVARVALLAGLIFALWWSLLRTSWDATPVICAVLLALALMDLLRYVESGTRDLGNLLRAVAGGDFTSALPRRRRGPPFAEYEEASRALIQTYQRLDLRRAASDDLLRDVVEHVGAAVLCFSASGRIAFANAAARSMLGMSDASAVASLAATDPQLPTRLMSLRNDERIQIELPIAGEEAMLLLHARRFMLLDESFTVVLCHDIRNELESRDMKAWQTLTRVLTHEMMNSLTPIMTLSGLLRDTMGAQPGGMVARAEDVTESIEVIHERSSGLARFIQAYRQFSYPPTPTPADIPAATLLERVARLKKPELDQSGIRLDVAADPTAMLHVDAQQMEQVLINLLRNAQDALAGQIAGRIELLCSRDARGRVLIHVADNGPGIPREILDKVFVPFFTTRTGGTGIGLALSRQIVQLNGGTIGIESRSGSCRFTLRLPGPE
jgi:nitrogen fixation/metabolism regulation signal transduction histidine kinase